MTPHPCLPTFLQTRRLRLPLDPADLGWAVIFLLLSLAFFRAPLFGDQVLYFRDLQLFFVPMKQLLGDAFRAGQMPWWNPFVLMGTPFFADPQSGVFYPPSLLFAVFDAPRGIAASLALHLFVAQAGAYALARHHGLSRPAAAVGALTYGLGGWMISSANMLTLFHSAAWAPWTVRACERLWQAPGPARFATCVLVLALQMYSGWPEMFIFLAVVLLVRRLAWPGAPSRSWLPVQLAAGGVAALLFAPQFLATWEAYRQSVRVDGMPPEVILDMSATPAQWRSLLFPPSLAQDDWAIFAAFPDGHVPIALSLYLGWVALGLAVAGILSAMHGDSRRLAVAWFVVAAIGAFMAVGPANPLAARLLELTDRFRSPEKYLFLVHLGLSMLAAVGASRLLSHLPKRLPTSIVRLAPLALVAALGGELGAVNRQINLVAPGSHYALESLAEVRVLASRPGRVHAHAEAAEELTRVRDLFAGYRASLVPNLGVIRQIPYVTGITFIESRDHSEINSLLSLPPGQALAARLGFFGAAYFASDDPRAVTSAEWADAAQRVAPRLWRLRGHAPYVTFPQRVVTAPDSEVSSLSVVPEFSRGEAAFVSAESGVPAAAGVVGFPRVTQWKPGRVDIDVLTPTGGLVVLRERFFPGWSAEVDGLEVPVLRANRFFVAANVPPGKHQLRFRFRPSHLIPGLALAAAGVLVLVGAVWMARRNQGRSAVGRDPGRGASGF